MSSEGELAEEQADLHGYIGSDFVQMIDLNDAVLTPDLENDIHPLFSESKFPSLSNAQYANLDPTLRLASRFLADARMTEFVCNLSNGRIFPLLGPNKDQQGEEIPKTHDLRLYKGIRLRRSLDVSMASGLNEDMWNHASQTLKSLADIFDGFEIATPGAMGDFTSSSGNLGTDEGRLRFPFYGEPCKITLRHGTTWDYLNYLPENVVPALVYRFMMATVLVHEIAHVLHSALHGWRAEHVFYGDNATNENGYDLEQVLFGGVARTVVGGEYCDHDTPPGAWLVFNQYPSDHQVRSYEENPAIRLKIVCRRDLDKYCIGTRIPLLFAASMFTEKFWTVDVPAMGNGPIQPPDPCRWVTAYEKKGDIYYLHSGYGVAANKSKRVPCTLKDPNLPDYVREVLEESIRQQRSRVPLTSHEAKYSRHAGNSDNGMEDIQFQP